MSRPFLADTFQVGSAGAVITHGTGSPRAGGGRDGSPGSLYVDDESGNWWRKVASGGLDWEIVPWQASGINGTGGVLLPGTPVASQGGQLRLGDATSQALSEIVGLVAVATAATLTTHFVPSGMMTLTTAEWDAVTGETGGLSDGDYFLSATPGRLTRIAPLALGSSQVPIGRSLASDSMIVAILRPLVV